MPGNLRLTRKRPVLLRSHTNSSGQIELGRTLVSALSATLLGGLCGYRERWTAENAEGLAEDVEKILEPGVIS